MLRKVSVSPFSDETIGAANGLSEPLSVEDSCGIYGFDGVEVGE